MRSFSSGDRSGQTPGWYWSRGLHDALIITVRGQDLTYDPNRRDPVRSCLRIELDSSQAMFDTTVKTILLYNYRILRNDSPAGGYGDGLDGCYWMQDVLKFENGKYLLEITALGEDDFRYDIRFTHAEVLRTE